MKKINIAYIILFISIIIILFGCKSKKQTIDSIKTIHNIDRYDSLVSSSTNETKNEIIFNNENISLEYLGNDSNDTLSVIQLPNKLIITGKGKLNINKQHHNISSKTLSAINDTIISINKERSIDEEISTKEEVITKRNGFNYYIIGLMALLLVGVLIANYIKNKF